METGSESPGSLDSHVIGVIADTHNLVRPEALSALAGVEMILHAGDVCSQDVLSALSAIAPTIAVRGNHDRGAWARELRDVKAIEVGGARLYMLHDIGRLDLDPKAGGFAAVITGHSHRPKVAEKNGVLFMNPGSAGPRRFKLPVSVGKLHVEGGRVRGEIVVLDV